MTSPAPQSQKQFTIVKSQVPAQAYPRNAPPVVTLDGDSPRAVSLLTDRNGPETTQSHAPRPRPEGDATVVVVSSAGRILWCSEVLAPVLGYAAFALWGHWIQELMEEINTAELPSILSPLGSSHSGITGLRMRLRHLDGSIRIAVGTATRTDDALSGHNYVLRFRIVDQEEEGVAAKDTGSYFSRVRFT